MDMRATHYRSVIPDGPPPCRPYEIERARAGNPLFCPLLHTAQSRAGMSPLYEEAAQLLKLLLAQGLQPCRSYLYAIDLVANAFHAAASVDASSADCGEFVLYRLEGMPKPGRQKLEAKLRAMIGTSYSNLRTARSIGVRR